MVGRDLITEKEEPNMLLVFPQLNKQSGGKLQTEMESLGWTFNDKAISKDDIAFKSGFNSASMSFSIDLFRTAKNLDLDF